MSSPTPAEIETFLRLHTALWNDKSKKAEFIAAHKAIAPGGYRQEAIVGGPIVAGWEQLGDFWDRYIGFKAHIEHLIVNGTEAAMCVRNFGTYESRDVVAYSLETYLFGADGILLARFFQPQY
jgi:hypothetical protein